VVQYVLELGQADASRAVLRRLAGSFAELSTQKFSSNVVEKCLKLGGVVSCSMLLLGRSVAAWKDGGATSLGWEGSGLA
jgi:hypothetical protein